MCCDSLRFDSLEECQFKNVNLANDSSTKIDGKGPVKLQVKIGSETQPLKLNDTLLVPDLCTNLMSVGKITDQGHTVTFTKTSATIQNQAGRTMMKANRVNGLYYVDEAEHNAKAATPQAANGKTSILETWHKRFGHLSISDLKRLSSNKM
ncbi:unnamed protein product, partial [Nesidiocoris tenuis]